MDRGECVLELLRRRHTDQDSAHRRVRQRKPRGGFGQAGGEPLRYQRDETAGTIDIGYTMEDLAAAAADARDPEPL